MDWVLLSAELVFKHYEVLPDIVSDHREIVVEVGYAGSGQPDIDRKKSTSEKCNNFDLSAD